MKSSENQNNMKLSIVVPFFNEEQTIISVLKRLFEVTLPNEVIKQIILVDDCSSDDSKDVVEAYLKSYNGEIETIVLSHEVNRGKGAAIHTGIEAATGDYIIVQDADLEYDPKEFNILLKPVLDGAADVVYGSRFMGGNPHRILFFWHSIGNKFLTLLSNAFNNLNLTDMETCYKLFDAKMLKSLKLKEKRFGFEPEVTAKISRLKGARIYEVGISYYGRTYQEGKKINWKDGVRAVYCIIKYGLTG